MKPPSLSILIPVFNGVEFTKKCLNNLLLQINSSGWDKSQIHLIVIDDGSKDNTSEIIGKQFPEVEIVKGDGNLWWTGSVNKGAEYAIKEKQSDYLLLWNNDVMASSNYFEVLKELIDKREEHIIYGSKIYSDINSKKIWSMGGVFNPKNGSFYMIGYNQDDKDEYNYAREVNWLPGMGTLIPKEVIHKIGLWDNANFPQYHGDSDYTYRAFLNGFKIKVDPQLILWNDTTNTGTKHNGDVKILFRSLTDIKSLYNVKVNLKFYGKYATNIFAYSHLLNSYLRYFGGFIKRKMAL